MLRNCILFLLGFLIWKNTCSQVVNQRFNSYTVDDGLSQNSVNAIVQDQTGFLWVATLDGLNRFDGKNFRVFGYDPDNPNSLPSTAVTSLMYDSNQLLWIGTRQGIVLYEASSEKFTQVKGLEHLELIADIMEDQSGIIWVLSDKGVYFQSPDADFKLLRIPEEVLESSQYGQRVTHKDLQTNISTSKLQLRSITEAGDGSIWIGTQTKGVICYDHKDNEFRRFFQTEDPGKSLPDDFVFDLASHQNFLWIATGEGLVTYDIQGDELMRPGEIRYDSVRYTKGARAVHISADGTVWFAYDGNGLSRYQHETNQLVNFKHSDSDPFSISSDDIRVIFEDRAGVIWIGTNNGGLNRYNPNDNFFETYKKDANAAHNLSSYSMRKIIADRHGFIWAATRVAGLNRINPVTREVISFLNDPEDPNSLGYNRVNQVLEDQDGNFWLGLVYHGLDKLEVDYNEDYSIVNYRFIHFDPVDQEPNSLAGGGVLDLLQQNDTTIWVACFGGLSRLNPKNNRIETFRFTPIESEIISNENAHRALSLDDHGTLWIGTRGAGLLAFDTKTEKFIGQWVHNGSDKNSLSGDVINCLLFDLDSQSLWIGTGGFGLNQYELESGTFKRFTEKDGLSNNFIYGILKDDQDYLWISTNKGINRFNPPELRSRVFRQADGLQSDEFNFASYSKSSDGKMYFGGVKGFNVFQPEKLNIGLEVPQVVITDFSLFNEPTRNYDDNNSPLDQSITFTKSIHLGYQDYVLSFDFIALNYENPELHHYAYKLENFNSDWVDLGNTTRVTFTNLDAGSYTFMVRAANREGFWGEDHAAIEIIIHPPWWETWIFRIALLIIFILAVFLLYQIRTRNIKARNKLLKKEVEERTRELKKSNEELQSQKEELQQTNATLHLTQAQLLQSEKMASIGSLSAGIGHEINNPLNYIKGGVNGISQYLEKEGKTKESEQVKRFIEIVNEGVSRASTIVKNLSKFSKPEDNKSLVPCEIQEMIEQALILLYNQTKNRIKIIKHFDGTKHLVAGNLNRLQQVFMSILLNAIQSIPEEGEIEITLHQSTTFIVTTIRDSGVGIPEKNLKKVMDPFFTTKSPKESTGLGLALAYKIVNEHKGTIQLESEVNKGTSVRISLPMYE